MAAGYFFFPLQTLARSSHFMPAFLQSALVKGWFVANAGGVIANPKTKATTETINFIGASFGLAPKGGQNTRG
jgi:hypothetical protein